MSADSVSLISKLSGSIGTSEPALKLLLSVLLGYPIALLHRTFFYGCKPILQHLYFILTGFGIGYLNYDTEICHAAFAIIFSYLTLVIFRGSAICVAITFIFNMSYLLIGYYYSSTAEYDINWTLPQCVLVLRLIGLSFDFYDGHQNPETLSGDNKKVALSTRPTILEYCGHMFFPSSFLVGPQFPMKRYQSFINGDFSEGDKTTPPNCVGPAIRRFALGVLYLATFQSISLYVSDTYVISDEYNNFGILKKLFFLGVWGRITLYKYIALWLLTEGACIMIGLTHNGVDEQGVVKWDGLANVDIYKLETATEFNHYIQSFNTNTNHWVAQYIYKRLKFMNNRYVSQVSALLFLAIWHGFHTGYYTCFAFEFMVMYMEKDIQSVLKTNEGLTNFLNTQPMKTVCYIALRLYTFVFMGWCLIPFALLTFDKYWLAYGSVYYIGFFFFALWPVVYGPVFRMVAGRKRPRPHVE